MKEYHRVKVWDLPVRLIHWSFVAMMLFLWYSGTNGEMMDSHFVVGYLIGLLVVFRILWGFFGSRYARFADFIQHPVTTIKSIPHLWQRGIEGPAGHNPLGGLMIVFLLLALLAQVFVGLGTSDDVIYDGPLVAVIDEELVELFSSLHSTIFDLLLLLVGLHLSAVVWHELFRKERITAAMIFGYKHVALPVSDIQLPRKALLTLIALVGCLGGVGWITLWELEQVL